MRRARPFVLLLAILATTACGYRMAGFESRDSRHSFDIAAIENETGEQEWGLIAETEAINYFSAIGALAAPGQTPDYHLTITLVRVRSSAAVTGSSGQATTESISVTLTIDAVNAEGATRYSFSARETYESGDSISDSILNRNDAFAQAVRTTLSDFRHEFN